MRPVRQLAVALLLAISSVASASAQLPVAAPALPVLSAEQKVEPILPADIPVRADADEQYIQSLATRARDARNWKRFEKELAVLSQGVRRLARQSEGPEVPALPVHRLESLQEHWQLYDREISRWRGNLQRATTQSSEDAAGLAARRAAWQAAREAVTGSAPALLRRVDELIGQIDRAERELSVPLGRLIELGRQGNALSTRVAQGSAFVLGLVEEQDRRLLVIDSPLLWQAPSGDSALDAGTMGLRASIEIETEFARDFDLANAKRLRVFAAISIFLLPVLLWLGRRAARLKAAATTGEYFLEALLRPWSAWLVLVALGYVLFNLQGPLIRQQAVMLLAWIPILRLLPRRLLALVGPWAYLSGLFYFLNVLGSLMEGHQLLYRSFLLTNNLLMLATLSWMLVRARRAALTTVSASWSHALHALVMLASAVLVAAVGSNVLGNVSLATMLTGALLDSSYMGLALASGAAVFVSLFQVLLSRQTVSQLTQTTRHAGPMIRIAVNLGRAVLVVGWLVVLLQAFRIYRPLLDLAVAILSHVFKFGELSISLGNVLAFLFATWLSFWLARTIRALLSEDLLPAMDVQRGIGNTISTLTYYAILFFGLVAALAVAGFRVGQLALAFGALGLGIGLGLQDVVKNFVSGLILMFERPIQPGDVVDVAGMSGTVNQIGMRSTIISTFDGADVVVPNGMLLADKLVNWTLSGTRRRFDIGICTGREADPRRTIALLVETAQSIDGVDSRPEPTAILTELAGGVLEFSLRAWTTADADWTTVRSELALRIRERLADAGIEIPLPRSELHLRSISSEAAATLIGSKPAIDR